MVRLFPSVVQVRVSLSHAAHAFCEELESQAGAVDAGAPGDASGVLVAARLRRAGVQNVPKIHVSDVAG